MSGKLLFFATKDDILSIMKTFCELLPFEIKYFETGNMSTSSPATFTSIEELPHIGIYYSKRSLFRELLYHEKGFTGSNRENRF